MIQAAFTRKDGRFCGIRISGHADYADAGQDIVCAAVSSAVQLSANLITDVFREKAQVQAKENLISIRLTDRHGNGFAVLNGLKQHLQYLSEDYPGTIELIITEV